MEGNVNLDHLFAVILGGGAGTRLWPLSRELSPKQLLKLFGTDSLIRKTVLRLKKLIPEENVFIVTSERLLDEIRNHLLSEYPPLKKIQYIIEPAARNTGPAVLLAAWELFKKDKDSILGVFPSDHYIENDEALIEAIKVAYEVAQKDYLVTFGLKPLRPETGFGYIELGNSIQNSNAYQARSFVEKPDLKKAKEFVDSGKYFWNSGMFVFKARIILEEGRKFLPKVIEVLGEIDTFSDENKEKISEEAFLSIDPISIDYGIMEKSERVAIIPVDIGWKDVGSLTALEEFYEKDERRNVKIGNIVEVDSEDSIFYSDSRLVAAIGLSDLMVIDTRDATLVCPKERAQEVAKIVAMLKEKDAGEYLAHRHSVRPWGSFVLLEKGDNYQVKLIKVKPGMKLSEQLHNHRSEHWIVVKGTAKVTIGGKEKILHAGESAFIQVSARHRLENPGKIPVLLIEVQSGEYLGEDDIVRFRDEFGRGKD